MLMRLSMVAIGLCMAISVLPAHADVYKWKDADGRVHYGDQPASGAERVNAGAINSVTPDDTAKAAATEDQAKKHTEECGRKRDQLVNYKKATRIVETDSLGNQKEFSEDERQKLIERTQKQITDGCADVPASDGTAAK